MEKYKPFLLCRQIVYSKTRMHSSRMHTVRCSGHLGERVVVCQGVSALGVCVYLGRVSAQWCLPRGAHLPLPPWTEFLTHACENITFPQLLLRTVKISFRNIFPDLVSWLSLTKK